MNETVNSVVIENLVKRFGDFVAVDRIDLHGAQGRGFRLSGAEWRGQIDDDSDAMRAAETDIGTRDGGGI